jgi:hypothetical protein
MFDFTGQNNDEISFKTGDIITVIDEIDKGWWLGELHSKRGIFPVNYTEDYNPQALPLPSLPDNGIRGVIENPQLEEKPRTEPQQQRSLPELSTSTSTKTIHHQLSNPRMAEAYHSDSASSTGSTNTTRRPPPPPVIASSPNITRPQSTLGRKGSIAIRAPPPPPSSILVHNLETHANSGAHTMIESPHSLRPSLDELPVTIHKPCAECECHDYIENLFKKGYCNNCFHRHDDDNADDTVQ